MDVDVRPVPVDTLTQYDSEALAQRRTRIAALITQFATDAETLSARLKETQQVHTFLVDELEKVTLAQRLALGDIVRVLCPVCDGTGQKPADDLTGGRIQTGGAFESTGKTQSPVIDDRNKCKECKGKRWIIMTRYKG